MTDYPELKTAPILLIAFNRPDLLEKAITPISKIAPRMVFLALDGARPGNADDQTAADACDALVRNAFGPIEDCELHVLRRAENLGMKRACVGAIDWFFDQVESGIIIEDDVVADPTFFRFATELLARYQGDERIMAICGTDYVGTPPIKGGQSYRFVRNFGVWGWATWRRAWRLNDPDFKQVSMREMRSVLGKQNCSSIPRQRWWTRLLTRCAQGQNPSWSFPWTFSIWREGGLCIKPDRNLVSNVGHDARATQTTTPDLRLSNLPRHPMNFPLKHPDDVHHDCAYDRWTDRHIKGIGRVLEMKVFVKRLIRSQ